MNIGVFFGSRSPEHDVSIITGQLIISELKKLGYNVVPVYLNKDGEWFADERLGSLKFFTNPQKDVELKEMKPCKLELAAKGRMVFKKEGMFSQEVVIDIAFPAFHGTNGEDGTIQGLFELMSIPYVGCDVLSSALAMDKAATKMMYRSEGIPTAKFMHFSFHEWEKGKSAVLAEIDKLIWPIFVKPARLGSSIGITKVKNRDELENACEIALHYDDKVIVEESVENMSDITCAVLGNDDPVASLVQEAVFSGDHFNYEDKYLENGGAQLGNAQSSLVIPADLSAEKTKEVQDMAVAIFKLCGCSGIARIDFLYNKETQAVYANEINTMPGTLYHHLWKKSGIEIGELLEKLIAFAQEKQEIKNKITLTFQSDLLKFANSVKLKIDKE